MQSRKKWPVEVHNAHGKPDESYQPHRTHEYQEHQVEQHPAQRQAGCTLPPCKGKAFTSQKAAHTHLAMHYRRIFTCSLCSSLEDQPFFADAEKLLDHYRKFHVPTCNRYLCLEEEEDFNGHKCSARTPGSTLPGFEHKDQRDRHMSDFHKDWIRRRYDPESGEYRNLCSKDCSQYNSLQPLKYVFRHFDAKHSKEYKARFRCPECKKPLSRDDGVKTHLKDIHGWYFPPKRGWEGSDPASVFPAGPGRPSSNALSFQSGPSSHFNSAFSAQNESVKGPSTYSDISTVPSEIYTDESRPLRRPRRTSKLDPPTTTWYLPRKRLNTDVTEVSDYPHGTQVRHPAGVSPYLQMGSPTLSEELKRLQPIQAYNAGQTPSLALPKPSLDDSVIPSLPGNSEAEQQNQLQQASQTFVASDNSAFTAFPPFANAQRLGLGPSGTTGLALTQMTPKSNQSAVRACQRFAYAAQNAMDTMQRQANGVTIGPGEEQEGEEQEEAIWFWINSALCYLLNNLNYDPQSLQPGGQY